MRVVHLNTDDLSGGASLAAYRLMTGQRRAGADAQMLVLRRTSRDPAVVSLPMRRIDRLVRRLSVRWERPNSRTYPRYQGETWTVGRVSAPVGRMLADNPPDVAHLHWSGAGYLSIEAIARLPRPWVWTLHDMWAVTGGCHYTAGCTRFTEGCGMCPLLGSTSRNDLSRGTWRHKQRAWSTLAATLITPSRWLAEVVRSSPLLGHLPVEVIPNGVDMQIFRPFERAVAREVLGLPDGVPLVAFGAYRLGDPRKGGDFLAGALRALDMKGEADLVVFGAQDAPPVEGYRVHAFGEIRDARLLALLYSAVDVLVVPSRQDNLPNTVMEALACGTPCVAFEVGGLPDLITHRMNGYLAQPFSVEDLAQGIGWALANRAALTAQIRADALDRFDVLKVAQAHLRLYDRLLTTSA